MSAIAGADRVHAVDFAAAERALLARCDLAVEIAARAGADEAEAFAARSRSLSVRFEKGDLKLAQVDDGTTLGLRVFRGRRMGFASTNRADRGSLESAARDALSLAAFAPPDDANVLPRPRALPANAPLVRAEIAGVTIERAVELGERLVRAAVARDPRISIDGASCDVSCAIQAVRATTGARAAESDAQLSLSISGMAIDGDDVGGMSYDADAVREIVRTEGMLERLVDVFAKGAIDNLRAGAAESYRGPVLFAPEAFSSLFVAPVVSAASSVAVQRGRSALAGKLGARIAVPAFSIVDDPTDDELSGACTFDREGQPARRFAIVERGVLRAWLYNGYSAAVDGVVSTGHARGSARAVPGLGPHALCVASGDGGDEQALARALGRGLFVQRFSGTVDPASGDFSGVAKSARWIENGVVVRSVKETLLSGNAFDLLGRIVALSSATKRVWASARIPWALVDGVSVTAG